MNFSWECEQEVDGRWMRPKCQSCLEFWLSGVLLPNAMAKGLRFCSSRHRLIDFGKMGNSSQSASALTFPLSA